MTKEHEKTADVSDRATQLEMETTDAAIRSARQKAEQAQPPLADGTYATTECEECGTDIGEGRLRVAAMNLLCVHCATEKELWAKRFGR